MILAVPTVPLLVIEARKAFLRHRTVHAPNYRGFGFTLALVFARSIAFRGRRTEQSRRHQQPGRKAQSAAYS